MGVRNVLSRCAQKNIVNAVSNAANVLKDELEKSLAEQAESEKAQAEVQ